MAENFSGIFSIQAFDQSMTTLAANNHSSKSNVLEIELEIVYIRRSVPIMFLTNSTVHVQTCFTFDTFLKAEAKLTTVSMGLTNVQFLKIIHVTFFLLLLSLILYA